MNQLGLIPKCHHMSKYHPITDLSHPQGTSINDGINPAFTSLFYTSVDSGVQVVHILGKEGSLDQDEHLVGL